MNKKQITGGILASLILATAGAGIVGAKSTDKTAALSEAQAIEIALAEVKGEVQETELEREHGNLVYEIEILTSEGREMEVEIDAETGEVLEIEAEDEDDVDNKET